MEPTNQAVTFKMPKKSGAKFLRRVKAANLSQSDVIRTALSALFDAHPTTPALIDAVIKHRTKGADSV